MKEWFLGVRIAAFRTKEVFTMWVLAEIGASGAGPLFRLMKRIFFGAFTCFLALGMF